MTESAGRTPDKPTGSGSLGPTASGRLGSSDHTDSHRDEEFVRLLTAEQFPLLQYIAVLLGDPHSASNVLQETNLVLWRKSKEFQPGTSFTHWSRKVAFWQVKAFLRDRVRDRHVFGEDLLQQLANRHETDDDVVDAQLALRHCLEKVSRQNVGILRSRYEEGRSIASIAGVLNRSESAVKMQLMRLRRHLQKCIKLQLIQSQL
jgi:RNA polymerase sigma-70 factor (ECF subfamily)